MSDENKDKNEQVKQETSTEMPKQHEDNEDERQGLNGYRKQI